MKNTNRIEQSRVAVTMVLLLSLPLFFVGIVFLPQGLHYYNLVLMAISTLAIIHTGYEMYKWNSQESKIKKYLIVTMLIGIGSITSCITIANNKYGYWSWEYESMITLSPKSD
ncbi:MAG: cation transport ATPase [Crocinitomicaceae bacterium]|jgi:cation transport ATPase